jgi:predicted DCC family thiol-disulfide oxidoreductase YuxK
MTGHAAYSYRDDPSVPAFADDNPVLLFDGECVFCSGWVQFLLKRDLEKRYRFIVAQTPLGEALYRHYGLKTRDYETNLLIDGGRAYNKSDATIRVLEGLGMPWALAGLARVVPRRIADAAYGVVARNRLKIAGRRESCMVPTAEVRERFLG